MGHGGWGVSDAATRTATSQDSDKSACALGVGSSPEICGKRGAPTPASLSDLPVQE